MTSYDLIKDLDPEALAEMAGAVSEDSAEVMMPSKPAFIKEGVDVVAVFADAKAQKMDVPELSEDAELPEDIELPDGEPKDIMLNTFWIYYSDNTFDQYAETPDGYKMFSTGTYTLKDDADFILDEEDNGVIEGEKDSVTYDIKSLGLTCFYELR